jgi:hypothetical protein
MRSGMAFGGFAGTGPKRVPAMCIDNAVAGWWNLETLADSRFCNICENLRNLRMILFEVNDGD